MKIGILIPDRGDRPELLKNCLRMIQSQTIVDQIDWCLQVNFKSASDACDITTRYRVGYSILGDFGVDVILFMENDDWYSADYVETMIREWEKAGRPDLFGIRYTINYHLKIRRYFKFHGEQSAHAMNTLIKPGMAFPGMWPAEDDPFTDQWLWSVIKNRQLFTPDHIISLGIKHGTSMSGGYGHTNKLHRFNIEDDGFLERTIDRESFEFYTDFSNRLNSGDIKQYQPTDK